MKAILRWFEFIPRLKVNFSKSRLFGVYVACSFMEGATSLLHCKKGFLTFCVIGASGRSKPAVVLNLGSGGEDD
jgi:hypothetical protein